MKHTLKTVLLGSVLLLSAGLAACDDEPAPPFSAEGTGTVQGRLFVDANDNGVYDPLGGDQVLSGVRLVVRERGTEQIFAGATATTDADGRFTIASVPLGTHDLFIDPATAPAAVKFCQNPIPTTVYLNEVRYASVAGRGACLISIGEAEASPIGTPVIVRGIVVAAPGQIRSDYAYIEDSSGGIRLFGSNLAGLGLEVGDRAEIGGALGIFNDDFQLTGVTLNRLEKNIQQPTARTTTTGAIAVAGSPPTAPLLGRLVRVEGARLTRGFTSGGARNALIDDGSGAAEIRIEGGLSGSGDDVIRSTLGLTVGNCYNITGVPGSFRGTGQLFPRTRADFAEVPCS